MREELRKVHADYMKAQTSTEPRKERAGEVLKKTLNQLLFLYGRTSASKRMRDANFLIAKLLAPGANMQKVIDGVGSRLLNYSPSNPMPFRQPSYYLKELSAEEEKDESKKKEHKEKIDQDYKAAQHDRRLETFIACDEVVKMIGEYLERPTCRALARKNQPTKNKIFLAELDRQFVKIPAGFIHMKEDVYEGKLQEKKAPVPACEITRYPVTWAWWNEVMGDEGKKPPVELSKNLHYFWNDSPVPAYDKSHFEPFLKKLNAKDDRCEYVVASPEQIRYAEIADQTGEYKGNYSHGVTEENVNQYVARYGSVGGIYVWTVGEKKLNKFGIEVGQLFFETNRKNMSTSIRSVYHLVKTCPKPPKP